MSLIDIYNRLKSKMITKIEVNGFKSLKDFELTLNNGLNILVGPNGSGKTNIVLFFEFLSKIVTMPVSEAITEMGGFGFVFQKTEKGFVDSIKVKIEGEAFDYSQTNKFTYTYLFRLKVSNDSENVVYENQDLIIISGTNKSTVFNFNPDTGSNDIEGKLINRTANENAIFKKAIEDMLGNNQLNFFQESILGSKYFSIFFLNILYDLKGGEIFNIIPKRIREQENAVSSKGIQSDGYGLSKTLYEMQRGNGSSSNYNESNFKKAIAYLKIANTSVSDLTIEKDDFNSKLVPKVYVKSGENTSILPLAFLSDGTLKWLTLVTAILTSDNIFCIEEPENYLHPWMQAEMCTLMREHLDAKKEAAFILMTTHSETLLNAARPEEVIVVDMKHGATRAQRVENPDLLREIISDSGFGLGHLYLTNSLSEL
jgi:predicted ATPase